jgi:hypothetical protein
MAYEEPSNKIPSDIVKAELKLREAVEELWIDTPFVRSFLIKAAKEYLKVFGKRGKIINISAPHFIFELEAPGWGRRRVRVPVVDFFTGSSQVAQRDYAIAQEVEDVKATQYNSSWGNKKDPVSKIRTRISRKIRHKNK